MKETKKKAEKRSSNKVHLYGNVTKVTPANNEKGNPVFFLNVKTTESYEKDGQRQYKDTFHSVSVATDDKALIEKINAIAADCKANVEEKGAEGHEYKKHTVSLDGTLITRPNETESGVTYYNQLVIVKPENLNLDVEKGEKEVRNSAEFEGNIAAIDMHDNFAVVRIATRYYAPGEAKNYKGEVKPYHEETSFVETRISKNFRPETFEKLQNGEIGVGDLVSVRGQIHSDKFEDKNGVTRYKNVTDLNNVKVIAKKKAVAEEVKEEPAKAAKTEKTVKKARSKRVSVG